ncbi:hypothetical protein [Streptomyces sp. NBC_00582]|uniref:hypothetical protein n=1 Tax=Streptomyces sp. NBC_00582 TaxID=2975783 RepID=UPI002E8231A2|nr:hypothetical protein [Streptomyces sp. NBC_00582]WUB63604.1 hypothetical protein OG852_26025 [Streptomyces sp. NBC_00582]
MTDTTLAQAGTNIAASLFAEHEPSSTSPDGPIRQGDVLEFLQPGDAFPFGAGGTLGFVVTANCDLAYAKNWNLITYVPAIPVESYVKQFVLPKEIQAQRSDAEKAVRNFFSESRTSDPVDRAFEMLRLGYEPEAIATLVSPNGKKRENFITGVHRLLALEKTENEIERCSHTETFCPCLRGHCKRLDATKSMKKAAVDVLRSGVRERLKRFPGDFLYVHKPSPHHAVGYVALLRLVSSVPDASVVVRPLEETPATQARRVARLNTLFCHRVVQQMAQVFTDIGLPADYEAARETHLTMISENWEY